MSNPMADPKNKQEAQNFWDALDKKIRWHMARAGSGGNFGLADLYRRRCNQLKKEWRLA